MEIIKEKSVIPISKSRLSDEFRKLCYLCGCLPEQVTREHVIPKNIFSPNPLQEPLILTACFKCNQLKKVEDEYASLILQASSNSNHGYEAFRKSMSIVEKKYRETGKPVDATTEGIGLVMGLRKSTTELESILIGGKVVDFNGGQFPIDSKRLNLFFEYVGKGLMVAHTRQIYDWSKFKVGVIFDQIDFPQLGNTAYNGFKLTVDSRQYAEKWGDSLFISGTAHSTPFAYIRSLHTLTIFNSFVAVIAIADKYFYEATISKHPN